MRSRDAPDREQAPLHVVVGDHRDVRRLADPVGAHRPRPRVGLHDLRHVAEELAHLAEALGPLLEGVPPVGVRDDRARQERRQLGAAAVRADGRTASALGRPERLVQHEHAGVEPQLPGAHLAHDPVEVGVVVEAEAAGRMDGVDPLDDVGVVDAHVVGVRDHQRRRAVRDRGAQRVERRVAALLERERDDVEPRGGGRRRVARVRLDRRDHLVALLELAPRGVVGARHAGMRVRGVGAAPGLEDELVHARQLAQDQVEAVHDLEHALHGVVVLVRVDLGDLRPRDDLLAEPRVVLHRARAEQVDAHHPERLLREMQVVALHLELRELGQRRLGAAAHARGDQALRIADGVAHPCRGLRKHEAAPARTPHLHHERLVPDRGVVAA